MIPINSTEELLLNITNDSNLSKEKKTNLINSTAYPNQEVNYAAGKPCTTCPPPQARPEFVENLIRSLGIRYTVTIYAAHPGTPLNEDNGEPKFKNGERVTSFAGHIWYEISDGKSDNAYGFAPIESGMHGDGIVTEKDTIHYEKPRYERTLEITEEQYKQLKNYGTSAVKKSNPDFDLYYNGAWNSCIDFTWKALRSAGLKPGITWNDFSDINRINKILGTFDGDIKVDNNIPHIKTIPAPFPKSDLNKEHYNKRPEKTPEQKLLTQAETNETDIKIS
ncbi:hypothetical protein [Xenorhabdus bovienii]|uniref:hypothetical protein n=1 Tax=Xenorhabdus bovienii TaxID=40576 RepID=UPI0023B252F4|nr:hypothetical protein [Xenorhabdus bovienii]MDE9458907.1 hypothetical protein [Xenorhabdus bovienii]MDE9487255.1 hypothetical protein [Xenorhabdus bovienii]MDE9515090.1 hypothetical protein [Xenorhabdus bovienii]